MSVKQWWHEPKSEVGQYVRHVVGLLVPGVRVPVIETHTVPPESLSEWNSDDLLLVVEEGRRQLDRQATRFDRVRTNAQFLFTTALGLLVVLAAAAHRILSNEGWALKTAWLFGLLVVALGTAGAAAVLTVRSDFGSIDTALLTRSDQEPLRELAQAYSERVRVGENTVAARITVYRDAVWLVLLGSLVQLVVWVTSVR